MFRNTTTPAPCGRAKRNQARSVPQRAARTKSNTKTTCRRANKSDRRLVSQRTTIHTRRRDCWNSMSVAGAADIVRCDYDAR